MNVQQALSILALGQDLSRDETREVIKLVMSGETDDAQIGALLMGLRTKGETVDELTGAVEAMRGLSTRVNLNNVPNLVDTCGTGGSGSAKLFNVSTASAFVTAAAGAHVAKHGNRKMSSSTGSADILEALGINITISPNQVAECVTQIGIGFLFAQAHHSAMRHAATARKALGIRTLFNLLGPMTNPAGAPHQVIGVFDKSMIKPMAQVLAQLEAKHVLVVHSPNPDSNIAQGLDEFSLAGHTLVAELKNGVITEYAISPEEVGLARDDQTLLQAKTVDDSVRLFNASLSEPESSAARLVAYNAGASIYACGLATTFATGVSQAQQAIRSGAAMERLEKLRKLTQSFVSS